MMAQATSENPPFQGILDLRSTAGSRAARERTGIKWTAELEANGIRVISTEEPVDNNPV